MKSPFSKPAGNVPRMSQLGAGSEIPTGAGILDRFISQLTFMLAIVIGIYIYIIIYIYTHIISIYIYIPTVCSSACREAKIGDAKFHGFFLCVRLY